MDVSYALAENIVEANAKNIPPEVVDVTRKCILDIVGCIFAAGTLSTDSKNVIDLFIQAGGNEEATIIGYKKKAPVWSAAFSNGVLAHALDFDDVVDEIGVHPSLCSIPAALALAEKVGGVTGKEFITAIALGNDLICRLGSAIKKKQEGLVLGFRPAPVLGIFGATAAASRVLKLNQEQVVDSLGIAFHQGAVGTFEVFLGPGDTKIRELYGGFIGMNGVLAALLAQRGITGVKTCFEGPAGLFNLYFQGKYDREYLIGDLGNRFDGIDVSLKPWSANRIMHAHVQAALELIQVHNISSHDIEKIILFVTETQKKFAGEERKKPSTGTEGRVSLPFCVGAAIATRGLSIWNFTTAGLSDDLSLKLAEKVISADTGYSDIKSFFPPGKITIELKSGKTYTKQIDLARGHPSNPMSFDDVANKFRDCAAYSVSPSIKKNMESIITLISNLEKLDDVMVLTRLLS